MPWRFEPKAVRMRAVSTIWTFEGAPPVTGGGGATVTLVEGTSFCISRPDGDIEPSGTQGLYFRDTRFLSTWKLLVNGSEPELLAYEPDSPFSAAFVSRLRPRSGKADSTLLVVRRRYVGNGMREDLMLRNLADEAAACSVTILADADFAQLFEVKQLMQVARGEPRRTSLEAGLRYEATSHELPRSLDISCSEPAVASRDTLDLQVVVPPRAQWSVCLQLTLSMDGEPVPARHRCDGPIEGSTPATRLRAWRRGAPLVESSHEGLNAAIEQSAEDLGALRIFDGDTTDQAVVAAGSPWFMTLFGRDSLITSYMSLLLDPDLAVGTVQTLARLQGEQVEPLSEEEPGRILHEVRWGARLTGRPGKGQIYYGSVDSTPLFVMLLGELRRWGLEDGVVEDLMVNADRALSWIENYGDRDGDGFVEYKRATDNGLANQGWKDSFDGINFADGTLAKPPIALCEVQGYVYSAYRARAHFAKERNDTETSRRYNEKAERLKAAFNEQFWLPDRGYFAVALDGAKNPVDSLTSNVGHCLWTGIVDEDKAALVAKCLSSPEMFTGWGVRTLASSMCAYNPMSYHNGSVWPHDSAIVAAGLMRYGFVEEAQAIAVGLLDAARAFGGRLPELFCGFDRAEFATPVAYPSSCSPQAWAAATPFSLLRTLLRFDPSVPEGQLWLAPALPPEIGDLKLTNVPLGGRNGHRLSIEVRDEQTSVEGLSTGIELNEGPRPVLSELKTD